MSQDLPVIRIIGAGMAGLLAANMLRRYSPVVYERQSSLPDNHHALLRFPTPAVSLATGIPFRRVLVHKGIWDGQQVVNEPTIPLVNAYSRNALKGAIENRSIWRLKPQEERWLAPRDFLWQLSRGSTVWLDQTDALEGCSAAKLSMFISTIPLPNLLKMREFSELAESRETVGFHSLPIYVKTMSLDVSPDVCQTVYNCSLDDQRWYRATIQDQQVIVESSGDWNPLVTQIIDDVFNIGSSRLTVSSEQKHTQPFGKIRCTNDDARRALIFQLTQNYNLYSLGRFATWRQILLDDVVQDVRRIDAMIHSSPYQRQLAANK